MLFEFSTVLQIFRIKNQDLINYTENPDFNTMSENYWSFTVFNPESALVLLTAKINFVTQKYVCRPTSVQLFSLGWIWILFNPVLLFYIYIVYIFTQYLQLSFQIRCFKLFYYVDFLKTWSLLLQFLGQDDTY